MITMHGGHSVFVKHLRLDRFGSWSGARIEGLSSGLNVLCGTGRATVHFVRAMLFGFDTRTRQGFLPVDSRGFGGAITVSTPAGFQTISRYDDGSVDGRLTVEHEDGSPIGRRHVQELLSGISVGTLECLFAVDFSERPSVQELVSAAQTVGIDLLRHRNSARLEELRRTLADQRRELESIPYVAQTLQELRVNRREVSDEIGALEQRLARCNAQENTSDVENGIRKLQDDIQAEQHKLQSLDATLQALAAEKRENHRHHEESGLGNDEFDRELNQIDQQLDRWGSLLQEVIDQKQSLQTVLPGDQLALADEWSVREHLRQLERRIGDLLSAVREADDDRWHGKQLRAACSARLQEMQDDVYRICHDLSQSEQQAQQIASLNELEQLSRCETELQTAIRNLVLRRRLLSAQRPYSDTVISLPEHAQLCQCHSHPQAGPQNTDALRRLAELVAEMSDIERRRERSIKTLNELEGELAELRTRHAAMDRQLVTTLAVQLETLRDQLRRVEQNLQQVQGRHELTVEIARLEQEIEKLAAVQEHSILEEASTYLRRLSGGDYDELEIVAHEVFVRDEQNRRVGWSQLPDGARDQVYLVLCLAVVAELHGRGVQLPVILSGAFTKMESKDVPEAAEVIRDFALQGHQVLFCTRHEHVINVFRLLNAAIHDMTSAAPGEFSVEPAGQVSNASLVDERPRLAKETSATGRLQTGSLSSAATEVAPDSSSAFLLHETCPIEDAPSIDEANAVRLRKIGVWTIGDLLSVDLEEAATRLEYAGVTLEMVRMWKSQTLLLCRVPHLRSYDARLLVACGVTDPDHLRRMQPGQVREIIQRFAASSRGQAVMMSGTEFELSRVADWITEKQETRRGTSSETRSLSAGRRPTAASHRATRSSNPAVRRSSASENRTTASSSTTGNAHSVLKFGEPSSWRFYLETTDEIVDAPSIGPRTAERLVGVGISTIADLLRADPEELAERLQHSRTNAETIHQWQQQTSLACRIPELRGHDAQILVALGITDPQELARHEPQELWGKVAPFVTSNQGKRIIRNGKKPDLQEVSNWIHWAAAARTLVAA